jgi:hypothetical protein
LRLARFDSELARLSAGALIVQLTPRNITPLVFGPMRGGANVG